MCIEVQFIIFLLQQGNRSSSSACGSADVLEALGVAIDLDPEVSAKYINGNFRLVKNFDFGVGLF